jgi:AcrR family transcriptional regulator
MSEQTISPPPAVTRKPGRIDGRRLRSERTKQLIVEAYLVLLREGNRNPTAAQTAERAGYSVRSVFERFPDLHALRVMATDYSLSQAETRAGTCERGVLMWRMLLNFEEGSEELHKRVIIGRERAIMRIEKMYEPELSTLAEGPRKQVLIALEAITDMESWARMRQFYNLSIEESCTLWIHTIDRLLPPTPSSPPPEGAGA